MKGIFKTKLVENFPPNSNPFHHDLTNMGIKLGSNLYAMVSNHEDKECTRLTLVHVPTGQRIRILIDE